MASGSGLKVAASGEWLDDGNTRLPAGEAHAWEPGRNQTLCGLALSRSQLRRFAHVPWSDVQPDTGGSADRVARICPRCAAATGGRSGGRRWRRTNPRP